MDENEMKKYMDYTSALDKKQYGEIERDVLGKELEKKQSLKKVPNIICFLCSQ